VARQSIELRLAADHRFGRYAALHCRFVDRFVVTWRQKIPDLHYRSDTNSHKFHLLRKILRRRNHRYVME
jgi:hypothetical protein